MPKILQLKPPPQYVPTEWQEQVAVFQWRMWAQKEEPSLRLLFASLNGVRVSIGLAHKMKQSGMVSGVPDLILPCARNGYFGLFIELKREKRGVVSDAQEQFIRDLRAEGYFVAVARGANDAIAYLKSYLALPRTRVIHELESKR